MASFDPNDAKHFKKVELPTSKDKSLSSDSPPSTTGSREKALPEKVWLNPHEFFEDDDETAIAFLAHPQQGELLWQSGIRTYYSESALSQARASAFEEALCAVEKYRLETSPYRDSLSAYQVLIWLRNRAARSSAGAEEGEKDDG